MDVNFTARPVAIYKPFQESVKKTMTVYELEVSDINFLKTLKKQIKADNYLKANKAIYREIALESIESILKTLKIKKNFGVNDHSVAYMAVNDKKVASLIQGNVPKVNLAESKIVYSTRNMDKESELDWLSTIPPKGNDVLPKAAAPAVVTELFNYCTRLPEKIKSIYVRSEIPKNCEKTVKFYEKLGFKPVGETIKWESANNPINLGYFSQIDGFSYSNDDILPMVISKADAKKTAMHIAKKFEREEIKDGKSIDLFSIVA